MPWVKKSPDEVIPEKKSMGILFLYFIFISTVAAIKAKFGWRKYYPSYPIAWSDFFRKIPIIIGASGFTAYFAWIFDAFDLEKKVLMCDKCENAKSSDGNLNCVCGGTYFGINEFKWVENNINKNENK